MPLRDHFHSPVDDLLSWEEFHGGWPMAIVMSLFRKLPHRYLATPKVHPGTAMEIDIATFHEDEPGSLAASADPGNGGGIATAVWAPAQPALTLTTDFPVPAEYEVRVYDRKRTRRLVAAIELVSPANKDRPEHRRAFVAKCAALLQERVSVIIVDLVTTRLFNLYGELLEFIGQPDPSPNVTSSPIYAAALRPTKRGKDWLIDVWPNVLTLGLPLPTLPLWLAEDLAIPLDLEESYEETCRVLRIP